MALPRIDYPADLDARARTLLEGLGYSLDQPAKLAQATLQLSDHYLRNPTARSPLANEWAQAAYLGYFLPLNYTRAIAVAREAARIGFFSGLERVVDFGAGLGSATFALLEAGDFREGCLAIDIAPEALGLLTALASPSARGKIQVSTDAALTRQWAKPDTLACFSYSLTEAIELPTWAEACEALLIIEPSTQEDGRKLQALRPRLQSLGFSIWAPCTHAGPCPLLERSAKDWCHGRAFFGAPDWWPRFESKLPMKNRTVTYSYLLARKSPPPAALTQYARTVGDPKAEKGRTRISICRSPERETLSWLPKRMSGEPPDLQRGDLVAIAPDIIVKGRQANSVEIRADRADQAVILEGPIHDV